MRKEMVVLALLVLLVALPIASAVTVNEQPVAVAKVSPEEFYACECEGVELDGSDSSDKDGWIVKYEWLYDDRIVARGVKTTLGESFTQKAGGYTITLKVTDDGGAIDTAEVNFRIKHNPHPQIEEMNLEIETEAENEEYMTEKDWFTVEVNLIEKEYGELTYNWNYDPRIFQQTEVWQSRDGQEASFKIISGGIGQKTSYEIGVTVLNACGEKDTDNIEVRVKSSRSNTPPEPEITFSSSVINEGESFRVSPAGSTTGQDRNENDDEIVAWYWEIINEQGKVVEHSTAEDPRFRIEDSGIYTISLNITDRFGATGKTSISFRVREIENDYPPTADVSSTKRTAIYGKPFELNGSGSNDNRDWDGKGNPEDLISWYIWRDETYDEELCRSRNPVCYRIFNRTGQHRIRLTVIDTGDKVIEEGDDEISVLSGSAEITIVVIAPSESPTPTVTLTPTESPTPTVTPTPIPIQTITPIPTPVKIPAPAIPRKSFLENFWETIKTLLDI